MLPPFLVKIDDNIYGYIPKTMTAGELINAFDPAIWTEVKVYGPEGELESGDRLQPGSSLMLKSGTAEYVIELRMLSELLRQGVDGPITLARVAAYVISRREDVTGDGIFDQRDVRLLLAELEN